MRDCIHCGVAISERRLIILPETRTCKDCSTVQAPLCFTVYSSKDTSELVVVDQSNPENVRQAWNGFARTRAADYSPIKKNPLRKCFE